MFRRDYLKDEIDRFGDFLRKLLQKLLDLPSDTPPKIMYETVEEGFTKLLNKSLKEALVLKDEDFISMVISETQNEKSIEALSEVFFLLASRGESTELTVSSYKKSLLLYQYLLDTSSTYSLEIHQKVTAIKNTLAKEV